MTRTITPEAMDNREGFEMLGAEGKEGFCKCKGRVDDEMECNDRNPRLLMKPLKVVLQSYLNRSRFCEGEVGSGTIEGAMMKLPVREVRVKCSKLSIGPPILLSGKSIDKVGGTGGKGALGKF